MYQVSISIKMEIDTIKIDIKIENCNLMLRNNIFLTIIVDIMITLKKSLIKTRKNILKIDHIVPRLHRIHIVEAEIKKEITTTKIIRIKSIILAIVMTEINSILENQMKEMNEKDMNKKKNIIVQVTKKNIKVVLRITNKKEITNKDKDKNNIKEIVIDTRKKIINPINMVQENKTTN